MTTWRVGIDESGLFNALDPNDRSYVGAVVTQKKDPEIELSFGNVYKAVTGHVHANQTELLKLFHGSEQKTNRNVILHKLLKEENLFTKLLTCSEKPLVFANNQQWWLSCVLGLIKKINGYGFIEPTDKLEIIIDRRSDVCLGFFSIDDVNPSNIWANLNKKIQSINNWEKNEEPISSNDFDSALNSAFKATNIKEKTKYETAISTIERLLKLKSRRKMLDEKTQNPAWQRYHKELKINLESEISKIAKCDFSIQFKSAKSCPLVALADQICNMQKNDFKDYISDKKDLIDLTKPDIAYIQNLTYGRNVEDCVKDGDYLEACNILLLHFFNGKYDDKDFLNTILSEAKKEIAVEIWRKIFHACDIALNNRGIDGNAIRHVEQIVSILEKYEESIPNFSLRLNYLKMQRELTAHSGKILDTKSFNLEELLSNKECEFDRDTERWSFYVEATAIQAQIYFNAYDFNFVKTEDLLKTQEQFSSIEYPFGICADNRTDENAAMLYGTIGQAAAFKGNLEKAALYFDRDYRHASDKSKSLPASFLSIVYHREENLEKAIAWFEKECNSKFDIFGASITQSTDQWLILNYFRLYALSLKKGIKNLPIFPAKELWERNGDYPWPLVLKWAAYTMEKLNRIDEAIDFLQTSYQKLISASGFTIKTLALSPMAMLIQISRNHHIEDLQRYQLTYRNCLERLRIESPTFSKYVDSNSDIKNASEGKISLWDAAMILPFNYS